MGPFELLIIAAIVVAIFAVRKNQSSLGPERLGMTVDGKLPKCTRCGNIGEFEKPPLIYKRDIIISVALLFVFGIGLFWFLFSVLSAKEPECPNCGGRGTYTYVYE
jgi:ribosomal protein S27AE